MTVTLALRQASLKDATFLAEFGAQTFENAFGPHNQASDMRAYLAKAFSLENVRSEIEDAKAYFYIAIDEAQEKVGYAKLLAGPHANLALALPTVELQRIYIASQQLGQGLGKQLLCLILQEAIRLGHRSIWLGVWEENKAAIRFYEKWGFTRQSEQPFMLGEDLQTDWLMTRPLPANSAALEKEFEYEI